MHLFARRAPKSGRTAAILIAALATTLGLAAGSPAAAATLSRPEGAAVQTTTTTTGPLDLAHAAAAAQSSGTPVVADALTTQTSLTTANVDGSFTRTDSATPVRKLESGTWVDLDPTLHTNTDGTISPSG